jgi:hypothetical protein
VTPIPLRFTGQDVPDLDARELREPLRGIRDRRPVAWSPAAFVGREDACCAHGSLGAAPALLDGGRKHKQAGRDICLQQTRVVLPDEIPDRCWSPMLGTLSRLARQGLLE